jgi:hypothetical protein
VTGYGYLDDALIISVLMVISENLKDETLAVSVATTKVPAKKSVTKTPKPYGAYEYRSVCAIKLADTIQCPRLS